MLGEGTALFAFLPCPDEPQGARGCSATVLWKVEV